MPSGVLGSEGPGSLMCMPTARNLVFWTQVLMVMQVLTIDNTCIIYDFYTLHGFDRNGILVRHDVDIRFLVVL